MGWEGFDSLVERAASLVGRPGRAVLGITGPPGAGKTTLVGQLQAALAAKYPAAWVAHAPMDGFHLADVQLDRLGLRDRKGAPETFDARGYAAALARLRAEGDDPTYLPGFERDLEQPLAAAVVVLPPVRLVLTEGNYLLLQDEPWPDVRAQLDDVWYVDVADEVRLPALVARHVRFGKDPLAAHEWAHGTDEANAVRVSATRALADLVVRRS